MKKFFSTIMAALMLLSCVAFGAWQTPAYANECVDPFGEIYRSIRLEDVLSEKEELLLLKKYAKEISYVNTTFSMVMQRLDEESMSWIRRAAAIGADKEGYRFAELLEELSAIRFEKAVCYFEHRNEAEISNGMQPMAHPDQLETRNIQRVTNVGFGPLKGKFVTTIPIGGSMSGGSSITISANKPVRGVTITVSVTGDASYSYSAPTSYTIEIARDVYVTHSAVFHVLWGRIETYSYDLYNVYTGEFVRHVSSTYVTDKDNLTYNCEAAILADYSYMRVPGKSTVYGASTFPQLRDGFCDHPWVYL